MSERGKKEKPTEKKDRMKNIFKKLHIGSNHDPNRSNEITPPVPSQSFEFGRASDDVAESLARQYWGFMMSEFLFWICSQPLLEPLLRVVVVVEGKFYGPDEKEGETPRGKRRGEGPRWSSWRPRGGLSERESTREMRERETEAE